MLIISLLIQIQFFLQGIDEDERKQICEIIQNTVYGRILNEIILYECIFLAQDNENISVYRFENPKQDYVEGEAWGEYDMVIRYVDDSVKYALFVIKHSNKYFPQKQCYHLQNEELLQKVCYNRQIVLRAVLFNGASRECESTVKWLPEPIKYINISDFLVKIAQNNLDFIFNTENKHDIFLS